MIRVEVRSIVCAAFVGKSFLVGLQVMISRGQYSWDFDAFSYQFVPALAAGIPNAGEPSSPVI